MLGGLVQWLRVRNFWTRCGGCRFITSWGLERYWGRLVFTITFDHKEDYGALGADDLKAKILAAHSAAADDLTLPRTFTVAHARISGRLDLSNLRPKDGPLIGLEFYDCSFEDAIVLEKSELSALSFVKSRLRAVSGNMVQVAGDILFDRVQSSEHEAHGTGQIAELDWHGNRGPAVAWRKSEDAPDLPERGSRGRCWVTLKSAVIGGKVELKRSRLVGPRVRSGFDASNTVLIYALDLGGAKISGSVNVMERSAILGGIGLSGTYIGQSLFVVGGLVRAGEGASINAQRVVIDGFVALRNTAEPGKPADRTECCGRVDFAYAVIKGAVDLSGALIRAAQVDNIAFTLEAAEIDLLLARPDGATQAYTSEFVGRACFNNMHVKETVLMRSIRCRPVRSASEPVGITPVAIEMFSSKIDGALELSGDLSGSVIMPNTSVAGNVVLGTYDEKSVNLPLRLRASGNNAAILSMQNMRIGLQLAVQGLTVDGKSNIDALRDVLKGKQEVRTRISSIPFADGAEIIEISTELAGRPHYGYTLKFGSKVHLMDGGGQPVASPFIKNHVPLDTPEAQAGYLKLYCSIVIGQAGPFRVIEPEDWFAAQVPEHLRDKIRPITFLPTDDQKGNKELMRCQATVWYGSGLFQATFRIRADNLMVEMVNDTPIGTGLPDLTWSASPLYYAINGAPSFAPDWPLPAPLGDAGAETVMDAKLRRKVLRQIPARSLHDYEKPVIYLRNTHANELADDDGRAWPRAARLDLAGFTYDGIAINTQVGALIKRRQDKRAKKQKSKASKLLKRPLKDRSEAIGRGIGTLLGLGIVGGILYFLWLGMAKVVRNFNAPNWWDYGLLLGLVLIIWRARVRSVDVKMARTTFQRRRQFLRLQYLSQQPTAQEFNPQPFEQMALVFRLQGQEEEFRRISRLKSSWQAGTTTFLLWRPFLRLYGVCFGYGFSIRRGVLTFALAIWLGWLGTTEALDRGILALNTSPDAIFLSDGAGQRDIRCTNQINPLLFALDKFLPLIDLGQEQICRVRMDEATPVTVPPLPLLGGDAPIVSMDTVNQVQAWGSDVAAWVRDTGRSTGMWQTAGALYKLIGWIVSSLLVLTFSKTFRRATGE
jgi:hypothetical protein